MGAPSSVTGGAALSTAGADYGPDETLAEGSEVIWTSKEWVRRVLRGVALVALISVMLNTPKTFEVYPFLFYWTYAGTYYNS